MPRVPYQPFPSAEPQVEPTRPIGLSVPGAAFGENVARAVEGLGSSIEKGADEAAKVALSYQAINNDTWAKNADADAMVKIGKLDADYKQLEGVNAVNALNSHQQAIKGVRSQLLDSAPNPAARRMLDDTITRRVGFALVDAGNYAGTQAKVAANAASQARLQAAQDTFDPTNPEAVDASLKTIEAENRHQGMVHGAEEDTIEEGRNKAQSKAWLNGLTKLAPSDPQKAHDIFEENKDRLDPQVREQLQNVINRNMAVHQTRADADDLFAGKEVAGVTLRPFDPSDAKGYLEDALNAAKDVAAVKGKDNPDYQDYLENRVRSQFSLGMAAYRDTQNAYLNQVQSFVHGADYRSKITSIDGVTGPNASPEIRAAYQSLDAAGKKTVDAYIAKENKVGIDYTPERQARYWGLMGMALHDPEQFAKTNFLNEDLPRGKIDSLLARQQQILKRSEPDTGLNRALSSVQKVLDAQGIGPSRTDEAKAETFLQFSGALEESLNEFKTEHPGKAPNDKELKAMTQDLLQKVITKKGSISWFNTEERRFEAKVPEDEAETVRQHFRSILGRPPTDDEIRSQWLRAKHFPTVQ